MKNIIQLHNCNKITSYYALIVTAVLNRILKKLSYMKQKAILLKSYVVFLALFLFLSSLSAFAATPVSDFTYTKTDEAVYVISYLGNDPDVVVPSEIEDLPVISLAGMGSYNKAITSVKLPDTLQEIRVGCFLGCTNLTQINLPEGLKSIGYAAFQNTGISSLYIPASVDKIEKGAFFSCDNLESLEVSESNQDYSSEEGILFDVEKQTLVCYPAARQGGEYGVPQSIISLTSHAFARNTFLERVVLSGGVKTIPERAFSDCSRLREFVISGSLNSIGNYAFSGCISLETIPVTADTRSIGYGAFQKCFGLENISLPDSVVKLGGRCFASCTNLTELSLGSGIEELPGGIFKECSSLRIVKLGANITALGDEAFLNCTQLREISLPDKTLFLASSVFEGCTALKEIAFGNNLQSIGDNAFRGCESLEKMTLPHTLINLGKEAFTDCSTLSRVNFKGNTPVVAFMQMPQSPSSPVKVFSEPYPTLYYLEGTAGWTGEYYTTIYGDFVKGEPSSSGKLIIYPGVEVGIPSFISQMRPVNWWTEGVTLETWTLPADEPEVFVSKRVITENDIQMTLVFGGALESSTNLKDWEPVETASPYLISVPIGGGKFYRTIAVEVEPPDLAP